MPVVQCACGRGKYDDARFDKCFHCNIAGKVRCSVCKKGYVDPTRYNVCYNCNQAGVQPTCQYCNDPNSPYVEYRNSTGTSLLCQSCFQTYGAIIVGQPLPMPGFGSSYTPDFGTREPVNQGLHSDPPPGFGTPPPPAGFGTPPPKEEQKYPGSAPAIIAPEQEKLQPQVYVPHRGEWVLASNYRMPDHHIVCYTREGKIPSDWKSRRLSLIRSPEETFDEFMAFIDLLEIVNPKAFLPMECVCLNYDHELCPNDGNAIFNGEAVCRDCINNVDDDVPWET